MPFGPDMYGRWHLHGGTGYQNVAPSHLSAPLLPQDQGIGLPVQSDMTINLPICYATKALRGIACSNSQFPKRSKSLCQGGHYVANRVGRGLLRLHEWGRPWYNRLFEYPDWYIFHMTYSSKLKVSSSFCAPLASSRCPAELVGQGVRSVDSAVECAMSHPPLAWL